LNIKISKTKFSNPEISNATKLQIITSQPKIASNSRRKAIFIKNPATAERLKIKNFLKKTPLLLFTILFLHIKKYEHRKLHITAASNEIVGDIMLTPK